MRTLGVIVALLMVGCMSQPKNQALVNPSAPVYTSGNVTDAIKAGTGYVPDEVSKLQYDGFSMYLHEQRLERNPDGSVYEQEVNGRKVGVFSSLTEYVKWNLNNTALGTVRSITFTVGKWGTYARDGFEFLVGEANEGIGGDASSIKARGEAEALVLDRLGMNLEKHWLGKANYLKIRNDGLCEAIKATGEHIVGKLLMLSPLGAAGNTIQAIIEKSDGSVEKAMWEKPE